MSDIPLYQIATQHRELERLATEEDIDPQTLADTLEALSGEFTEKAKSVAMFIGNLESDAAAIDAAAKAMMERAKRVKHRAEAVKEYLRINMMACNYTKISTPWFVISLQKNPPRVDVMDAGAIPEKFLVWPEVPPPAIDKRAVLAALKAGESVPGAVLAQDERVVIKA